LTKATFRWVDPFGEDGAEVGDPQQMARGLGGNSKYDPSKDRPDIHS
jgi:hypothetical protein